VHKLLAQSQAWRAAAFALALLLLGAGGARAQDRNILLIVVDDFGVDAASFYPLTAGRRTTRACLRSS
jgi:hypothetical protein